MVKSPMSISVIVKQSGTSHTGSDTCFLSSPDLMNFPIARSFVICPIRLATIRPFMLVAESSVSYSASTPDALSAPCLNSVCCLFSSLLLLSPASVISSSSSGLYSPNSLSSNMCELSSKRALSCVLKCSIIHEISVSVHFLPSCHL